MRRTHAFLLGLLAFGVMAISLIGLTIAPPCISGPSVPRQYPLFVVSLCINYVFAEVAFLLGGVTAFCYALREGQEEQ